MGFWSSLKRGFGKIGGALKKVGRGIFGGLKKGFGGGVNLLNKIKSGIKTGINTITNIPVLGDALKMVGNMPIPRLGGLSLAQVLATADKGTAIVSKLNDGIQGRGWDKTLLADFAQMGLDQLQQKYPGLDSPVYSFVKQQVQSNLNAMKDGSNPSPVGDFMNDVKKYNRGDGKMRTLGNMANPPPFRSMGMGM